MKSRDGNRIDLTKLTFFSTMAAEHLSILQSHAKSVVFPAGAVVFRESEPANKFFLIRSGKISVVMNAPGHEESSIQNLGVGEVLGWSWLFPPYSWAFDARANEDTEVIVFDGGSIRKVCEQNPAFGYELIKRFARIMTLRLSETRNSLLQVVRKQQILARKSGSSAVS